MALSLKPSIGGTEDFLGTTGSQVTLKLQGPANAGADLVHVRYDGAAIASDPPQFAVKSGLKLLVVLAEASKPGALLQLIEDGGGGVTQVLDRFHFDPMNPARGYIVRGTPAPGGAPAGGGGGGNA